jgi:hypothetical protein
VVYGDAPLGAAQVIARTEATAAGSGGPNLVVRVQASVPVNEPIVLVSLRAGCRQKTSRQFTLFTELPTA